jgi:hypothetical protein
MIVCENRPEHNQRSPEGSFLPENGVLKADDLVRYNIHTDGIWMAT